MRSLFSVLAACLVSASAWSATFEAAVWRGETAYVRIPEALQNKAAVLYGSCTDGDISFTLLRFDEVKYDLSELVKNKDGKMVRKITGKGSVPDVCRDYRQGVCPRRTGKGSVPDVCRERKAGDTAKPTMIKVTAKSDAKPTKRVFKLDKAGADSFAVRVVDRVLPPAKDWKYGWGNMAGDSP